MKRGVPKKIESPEMLWEYFQQYKEWARNNPFLVHDFVGKDGKEIYRYKQRPLSMLKFSVFLNQQGIISRLDDYVINKEGRYADFASIIASIKAECESEQLDGAVAGVFNSNIISRMLGLADKQNHTHDGTVEIVMTKGKTLL